MSSVDQKHFPQQIEIPPKLPRILKEFCKAAIRTQPYDLLKWSCAYFRALANGEEPPVKLRLEYPRFITKSGLTLGILQVLLRQFGDYNKTQSMDTVSYRWDCLCLNRKDLNLIIKIGRFRHVCQIKQFLAIAAGLLTSSLSETMIVICELFTREPPGGSAMISVNLFMEIYGYLAGLRCDGDKRRSLRDNLSDFTLDGSDRRESNASSHTTQESREFSKKEIERPVSNASQDTELDVKEFELESKDEVDTTGKHDNDGIIEAGKVNSDVDKSFGSKMDEDSLNTSKEADEKTVVSEKLNGVFEKLEINVQDAKRSKKPEERSSGNSERITERSKSSDDNEEARKTKNGAIKKKKRKIGDSTLFKYYPNVPGIGPRLSAEQVANVAIWMSECARRQEGMVGPRNIRHFECPSLNKQETSEAKTV